MRDSAAARVPPPLVGRERELASLTGRLRTPRRREADVVLFAGEPGVGKTRLMQEVADTARALGWVPLVGHAYDTEGMPPYLPFIEALQDYVRLLPFDQLAQQLGPGAADIARLLPEVRHRLPDLPASAAIDPESERYRLFESIAGLLDAIAQSAPTGVLICLDDLHWADESTLLLLEHLTRKKAGAPILVIGSYRDTDLDVSRPLAHTLEQLMRQRAATRIDLKRLDRAAVAALLTSLGGSDPPPPLVDAIFSETEGNPFFVREVFEYLAGAGRLFDDEGRWRPALVLNETDVPQGLRLVIGRRLERLSEDCRRLLALAAILGRNFSYELLRKVADPSAGSGQGLEEDRLLEAVEEAERAHLLTSDAGGQIAFAHELIRQTLLTVLSALRPQRLHLSAAMAIEKLYGDHVDLHSSELAERRYVATVPTCWRSGAPLPTSTGSATRTTTSRAALTTIGSNGRSSLSTPSSWHSSGPATSTPAWFSRRTSSRPRETCLRPTCVRPTLSRPSLVTRRSASAMKATLPSKTCACGRPSP